MSSEFVRWCHWIEGTSDNAVAQVKTEGLGLLAETRLDEIICDNPDVGRVIEGVRHKTKLRKKELAQERRDRALGRFGTFHPLVSRSSPSLPDAITQGQSGVRGAAASILAPVLGLFRDNALSDASAGLNIKPKTGGKRTSLQEKPAWMTEMEAIEDETGLTCAVRQEGRVLQPADLLGLYAHVRKVLISPDQCGARTAIKGVLLLKALPASVPAPLVGTPAGIDWLPVGRAVGEDLPSTSTTSSSGSSAIRRSTILTTTVSAGNAIHFTCHRKARHADRNHPIAPKSEWEGASLRNSCVSCNVIIPLVSTRSSKVPLMAVDAALTEHQTAISNLLGSSPPSLLWTVLHDMCLLLLRISYGEALNADCGGGSLSSNIQLLFYQMFIADVFDKEAAVEQPLQSQHARCLSTGFLAACAIVCSNETNLASVTNMTELVRGIADAAPMALMTCILFHNTHADCAECTADESNAQPHPKRQWEAGKDYMLKGLLTCAGRRHVLGIESSGCVSSRGLKRQRSTSFADWEVLHPHDAEGGHLEVSTKHFKNRIKPKKATMDDFQNYLRPMLIYFAFMDRLSTEFSSTMEDHSVYESSERIAPAISECHRCKGLRELLRLTNVGLSDDEIMEYFQKGIMAA